MWCRCHRMQTYEADTITSKKANFDMENVGYVSQYNTFKKYQIDYDLATSTISAN